MDGSGEPRRDSGVAFDAADVEPWIRDLRSGDPAAFDRVAQELAPRLYRLALRLTGRREDAEDLVQETFVRCLPALRNFEGRSRVSTYLIRALGNVWRNRLRTRRRSRLVPWLGRGLEGPIELDPPSTAPRADERLAAAGHAERIRAAVVRLEPKRRWTLLLREVEEMSYEQIAEVTDTAVGTVRSRLARARADLRRILEREESP
jgi:RNA polymerase sigma-70 factor (ECF subfamily)